MAVLPLFKVVLPWSVRLPVPAALTIRKAAVPGAVERVRVSVSPVSVMAVVTTGRPFGPSASPLCGAVMVYAQLLARTMVSPSGRVRGADGGDERRLRARDRGRGRGGSQDGWGRGGHREASGRSREGAGIPRVRLPRRR
ncbi:hypothetical protein ACFY7Z_08145 [Streptomyces sp. NPDC012623]|uniref:hypothetical protein n=1 Tax=unclassified Streptomyces TaxID=2593676 RepID=UPI00367E33F9